MATKNINVKTFDLEINLKVPIDFDWTPRCQEALDEQAQRIVNEPDRRFATLCLEIFLQETINELFNI